MGKALSLLIALALVPGAAGTTGATTMGAADGLASSAAYQPTPEGSSPPVPGFLRQLRGLKHHAEAIGWMLDEANGAPDPDIRNHYQGICRYPGAGVPVFYITQKEANGGGYLLVVKMGSRPQDGERLRSNLQSTPGDTRWTFPPSIDRALLRKDMQTGKQIMPIRFDGSSVEADSKTLRLYVHPGGVVVEDNVLFVGMDQPSSGGEGYGGDGMIVLFDLGPGGANRTEPEPIQFLTLEHGIDNLAVTRLANQKYLIWINGSGGKVTHFYETTTTNLRADDLKLRHVQAWNPYSDDFVAHGEGWPTDLGAHQGSAFVREGTGPVYFPDAPLYMIGMRKHDDMDLADVYRVKSLVEPPLDPDAESPRASYQLEFVRTVHFFCGLPGTTIDRICSFMGAGNAYVSPTGELIIYTVQRDDEDWGSTDFVRMGEFRHREVNRPESPLRQPGADPGGPYQVDEGGDVTLSGAGVSAADRPWVEIYQHNHGWLHEFEPPLDREMGRSIVVDYDDRGNLELEKFEDLDSFDNETTAVVWRMPVGLDAVLYQHSNFGGRRVILRGTGSTEFIHHLNDARVEIGVVEHEDPRKEAGEKLDFNDRASSLKFVGQPGTVESLSLEWDLDGDGVYGEMGAAAERGNEVGPTPSFWAAYVDGPTDVTVELRACDGSGRCEERSTTVHVRNVAPDARFSRIEDGAGRGVDLVSGVRPVLLEALDYALVARFADAGVGDTHTARIDWGDGLSNSHSDDEVLFADTQGGEMGSVRAPHAYASKGTYSVVLAVEDDDGGVGRALLDLEVVDATGALERLIEALTAYVEGVGDPGKRVRKALDKLQGKRNGKGKDGALDLFARGKPKQALKKIRQALKELERAQKDSTSVEVALISEGLALVARSQAAVAIRAAEAGTTKPGDRKKVDTARSLLAEGDELMGSGDYVKAVDKYRKAFKKVEKHKKK